MNESPLVRLIEADDPIQEIWKFLIELWDIDRDIKEYFLLEEKESLFENTVSKTFFEFYGYLQKRMRITSLKLSLPIIIVDGMSIREGNLLVKDFKERGYKITSYDYSFASLPSTTSAFRERFMPKYSEIRSGKIPSDIDFEEPIWLSFPDEILHHAAELIPFHEAYEKTRNSLMKILNKVQKNEITLISDHGYIIIDNVWPLAEKDIRFSKSVFGAQRFAKNDEIESNKFENLKKMAQWKSYVFVDEQYSYIKGRYFWPISGYGKKIAHGGLSIMESIVPIIKVMI